MKFIDEEKKRLKRHYSYVKKVLKDDRFKSSRLEAEIIRNVHSVEKGLSLDKPRKLFGIKKINDLLNFVDEYLNIETNPSETVINMAIDSLKAYFDFHSDAEYTELDVIKSRVIKLEELFSKEHLLSGGTVSITPQVTENDYESLLKIASERHSMRDFSGESVPFEKLRKAFEIAQKAPSACNRQGVRAYVVSGDNKNYLADWLSGTGGFSDAVDKYIIVTGKLTAYRNNESFQFAVSASIFSGYLVLALQSVGIGACMIQRPLVRTEKWAEISKKLSIPDDEQVVLMIGTGMPKSECKVPVSNRISYDEQVKEM